MTQQKEFKEEQWRDLYHCARHKDGQCMYQVSDMGNVRMRTKDGFKPIRSHENAFGYYTVTLLNGIFARQKFYTHRLLAVCFIPNPFGYDTVDHIDGDKSRNCKDNLRWVSRSTNISLGHLSGNIHQNNTRHPVKLTKGNREMCFETMSKAACFLGCSIKAVLSGLQGKFRPKGWEVTSLVPKEVNGNIFNPEDFERVG